MEDNQEFLWFNTYFKSGYKKEWLESNCGVEMQGNCLRRKLILTTRSVIKDLEVLKDLDVVTVTSNSTYPLPSFSAANEIATLAAVAAEVDMPTNRQYMNKSTTHLQNRVEGLFRDNPEEIIL